MKLKLQMKTRLDVALVERGLAESRQKAQAMILAGHVKVNGQPASKAGAPVAEDARVELAGAAMPYVSRGGLKLEGALDDFGVNPVDLVCLDVGSSTGGFTDCLLQRGAARVYCVDVSADQLAWKLRQDARVHVIEKNARYLQPADVPEPVALITVDLSFISTAKVLPALVPLARPGAQWLILVKPQFELERGDVGKGGIVRDPALHRKAVERVERAAIALGLTVRGVKPSRLPGAKGNLEFILHAQSPDRWPLRSSAVSAPPRYLCTCRRARNQKTTQRH
jgi:23S rRNA (cytidine1920-2'-O)/16S rRNA (cytidine1409-2'-O)-methyltransferase